jgi:hypothetical protein
MAGVPHRLREQIAKLDAEELAAKPVDSAPVLVSVETKPVDLAPVAPRSETPPVENKQDQATQIVAQPAIVEQPRAIEPSIVPKTDDEETWKARYQSLKGKYDAEISTVNNRLDTIERSKSSDAGKLEDALRKLSASEKENAELRKAKLATGPVIDLDDFTEEEREAYGDSLPVIAKAAQKIVDRGLQGFNTKLSVLEQERIDQRKAIEEDARNSALRSELQFVNDIAKKVSGSREQFDALCRSPDFADFRDSKVMGGSTVAEMLMNAHNARSEESVLYWFNLFKQSKDKPQGAQKSLPVVPGKTTGEGATLTNKPILNMAEYKKLHTSFIKGLITQKEWADVEKIYDAADAEGRLQS